VVCREWRLWWRTSWRGFSVRAEGSSLSVRGAVVRGGFQVRFGCVSLWESRSTPLPLVCRRKRTHHIRRGSVGSTDAPERSRALRMGCFYMPYVHSKGSTQIRMASSWLRQKGGGCGCGCRSLQWHKGTKQKKPTSPRRKWACPHRVLLSSGRHTRFRIYPIGSLSMGVTFRKCELGGLPNIVFFTAYLTGNDRALSSLVFSTECQVSVFFPFFEAPENRFYGKSASMIWGGPARLSDAVCWSLPFILCCEGMTCLVPAILTQDDAPDHPHCECPTCETETAEIVRRSPAVFARSAVSGADRRTSP
jgi:hypothetical protein